MQLKRKFEGYFGQTAKAVLSAILVLQLVFLLVLAASPALHHAFHPDSDKADHDCLVTAFIKGQLTDAVMAPILVVLVAFLLYTVLPPSLPIRATFKYCFAPSRAPPRF